MNKPKKNVEHVCCYCYKKGKDVNLRVNPFKAEFRGDTKEEYLCNDCFNEAADEV